MSAPETKALPPAPDMINTRTDGSGAYLVNAASTASHISSETALRFSGWLKMIRRIAPVCSTIIFSVIFQQVPRIVILRLYGFFVSETSHIFSTVSERGQDIITMATSEWWRCSDSAWCATHHNGLANQFCLTTLITIDRHSHT